jgi:hypothetical protein
MNERGSSDELQVLGGSNCEFSWRGKITKTSNKIAALPAGIRIVKLPNIKHGY